MRATSIVRTLNVLSLAREESGRLIHLPQQPASPRPAGRPDLHARALRLPGLDPASTPVDLTVRFGESIGITSTESATRSAVLKILAGETEPQGGEVLFGGLAVSGSRLAGRGGIVYVSPQTELFSGTILENLTAFDHGGSLEDVIAVCDLLGIRSAIDRLPSGFDTIVGEGASDPLQSGLAQRIAIARALALRPKLIVLDEPQALLDSQADRALLEGLSRVRGRITMIIGSQRPSYLGLADRVFTLVDGRLVERASGAAQPESDPSGRTKT
jgi:ABC-type bacteriocin/lantibiotic exporter with double-glycine peptidase domain